MSYRKLEAGIIWHWCHNCSNWPLTAFTEREDKPVTWADQSLCRQCATMDAHCRCVHSVELRTGLAGVLSPRLPENG